MIKELYIDNFRCLVNFKISLEASQLWLGDNGTGKTSVLEVLQMIQRVVGGDHVEDIFSASDLTAWRDQDIAQHTFRFTMVLGDDEYAYSLTILYAKADRRCSILNEEVKWNGDRFYYFDGMVAHLFHVGLLSQKPESDAEFGADCGRSLIPLTAKCEDYEPLIRFRDEVGRWLIVRPIPAMVEQLAEKETHQLSPYAGNFAEWYRHLLLESPQVIRFAAEMLEHVLPGFQTLSLKEVGESRRLTAVFRIGSQDYDVPFDRLSDGQKQLIVLYVILQSLKHGYSILLIDEPDNFVSLREIQPWLQELHDMCSEGTCQSILVSHHPEIINEMARGTEAWFHRPDGRHTQIGHYPTCEGHTPAETMARGWDDE